MRMGRGGILTEFARFTFLIFFGMETDFAMANFTIKNRATKRGYALGFMDSFATFEATTVMGFEFIHIQLIDCPRLSR